MTSHEVKYMPIPVVAIFCGFSTLSMNLRFMM